MSLHRAKIDHETNHCYVQLVPEIMSLYDDARRRVYINLVVY